MSLLPSLFSSTIYLSATPLLLSSIGLESLINTGLIISSFMEFHFLAEEFINFFTSSNAMAKLIFSLLILLITLTPINSASSFISGPPEFPGLIGV